MSKQSRECEQISEIKSNLTKQVDYSYINLANQIPQLQNPTELYADRRDIDCKKVCWTLLILIIAIASAVTALIPNSLILIRHNQQSNLGQFSQLTTFALNQAFIYSFFWLKLSFTVISIISLLFYIRNFIKTPLNQKSLVQILIILLSIILVILNLSITAWEKYYTFQSGTTLTGNQQKQMASYIGFTTLLPLFWVAFTNNMLLKRPFRWGFFYEIPYFMFFFIWLLSLTIDIKNQYICVLGISKGCVYKTEVYQLMEFVNQFRVPMTFFVYSLLPLFYCTFNLIIVFSKKQTATLRNQAFLLLFIPTSVVFYVSLAFNGLFYLDLCAKRVVIVYFVFNSYLICLQLLYSTTSVGFKKLNKAQTKSQDNLSITTNLISQQIALQNQCEYERAVK